MAKGYGAAIGLGAIGGALEGFTKGFLSARGQREEQTARKESQIMQQAIQDRLTQQSIEQLAMEKEQLQFQRDKWKDTNEREVMKELRTLAQAEKKNAEYTYLAQLEAAARGEEMPQTSLETEAMAKGRLTRTEKAVAEKPRQDYYGNMGIKLDAKENLETVRKLYEIPAEQTPNLDAAGIAKVNDMKAEIDTLSRKERESYDETEKAEIREAKKRKKVELGAYIFEKTGRDISAETQIYRQASSKELIENITAAQSFDRIVQTEKEMEEELLDESKEYFRPEAIEQYGEENLKIIYEYLRERKTILKAEREKSKAEARKMLEPVIKKKEQQIPHEFLRR